MTTARSADHLSSRRDFLKASTAAAGTAALLGNLPAVHAAGNEVLKIGLVGCGGRGKGALGNCLHSSDNLKVWAIGDAFKDRLEDGRTDAAKLAQEDAVKQRGNTVDLPPDRCFVGLDAYQKVIDSGIDLVLLATPPGFRPQHLQYAVEKGKNIFTEKPVGVDGPGIRKVLAAYEEAKKKNLGIVAGTQRRHQTPYLEAMKRVHDGAIGDVVAGRCYWNQGGLWSRDKEQMGDLEWQIRNWLYLVWLSGDHICEQHIHNLDVMNWAIRAHPLSCQGMGGRQVRTAPVFGHIFDHFAIEYVYPNDVHVTSMCRQIDGTLGNVSEDVVGTKGACHTRDHAYYRIKDTAGQQTWTYGEKDSSTPYVQEHTDLIASIRAGKPLNELQRVAESTLTAIMGRMAAYTGKNVTWEAAINSKEDTFPAKLSWDIQLPVPPVAVPGRTPLV